jgi:hypothetical protein
VEKEKFEKDFVGEIDARLKATNKELLKKGILTEKELI